MTIHVKKSSNSIRSEMFYTIILFHDNLVNLLFVCTTSNQLATNTSATWMNSLGRSYIRRGVQSVLLNSLIQKLVCHVDPYNQMGSTKKKTVKRQYHDCFRQCITLLCRGVSQCLLKYVSTFAHSTANVVVTHETRKEQQSATIDLKWCISIGVQTYMYCSSWEIVVQHDNISKPLFVGL